MILVFSLNLWKNRNTLSATSYVIAILALFQFPTGQQGFRRTSTCHSHLVSDFGHAHRNGILPTIHSRDRWVLRTSRCAYVTVGVFHDVCYADVAFFIRGGHSNVCSLPSSSSYFRTSPSQ